MGACCGTRGTFENRDTDLSPPRITGNMYQRFELSFPFSQTYVDVFAKKVRAAAAQDKSTGKGNGQTVTLESLQAMFKSPAWAGLSQTDSKITKLIKSPVFRNQHGKIDGNWLILFGFLHCPGDVQQKSEVLYTILQEGGQNQQPYISSTDKDINLAVTKLVNLVTVELIQLMQEVGCEDEVEELEQADLIDYEIDDMLEWNYLDPLFKNDSKLTYEDWLKRSN